MNNQSLIQIFQTDLLPSRKIILIALAAHVDESGICEATANQITAWTGLRERTIRTTIKELNRNKLVRSEGVKGRVANRYRVFVNGAIDAWLDAQTPRATVQEMLPNCASVAGNHAIIAVNRANDSINRASVAAEPCNSCMDSADLLGTLSSSVRTKEESKKERKKEKEPTLRVVKKATRIPPDWNPGSEGAKYARAHGLDPLAVFEDFRDYWTAKATDNAKLDWQATWRRWCRNAPSMGGAKVNGHPTPSFGMPDYIPTRLNTSF